MYEAFALVYDELMDDAPYEKWADMLCEAILKQGISKPYKKTDDPLESERNLVLDLACGTGTLTELMYKKGFDMIGVDLSQDMLDIALKKKDKSNSDILYLNQDMRELDLYSTVGTVYCLCDSINYLLEDKDIAETFSRVYNFLYSGGIFIFDFNTAYKYEHIIGDRIIAEDREDVSFIWENFYDTESRMNEYDLAVFIKDGEHDGLYRKFTEAHLQRAYSYPEMKVFLEEAGFKLIDAFDMDLLKKREPEEISERIFFVARKPG